MGGKVTNNVFKAEKNYFSDYMLRLNCLCMIVTDLGIE